MKKLIVIVLIILSSCSSLLSFDLSGFMNSFRTTLNKDEGQKGRSPPTRTRPNPLAHRERGNTNDIMANNRIPKPKTVTTTTKPMRITTTIRPYLSVSTTEAINIIKNDNSDRPFKSDYVPSGLPSFLRPSTAFGKFRIII